jgi:hypothetical protein
MQGSCWLAVDSRGRFPAAIVPAARLRNLEIQRFAITDGVPHANAGPATLIAAGFDSVAILDSAHRTRLSEIIASGGTLYLRGGVNPETRINLSPFVPEMSFSHIAGETCSFASDELVPHALRGDRVTGHFQVLAATLPSEKAIPLIRIDAAPESVSPLFMVRHGAGLVILDLSDNELPDERNAILRQIEEPSTRHTGVGPLIAANRAARIDPATSAAFNLVIDDRPANFDYLNVSSVRKLMRHLERQFPGVHVDFGWTPDQTRPSMRYVRALKEFNTGFVWHGLLRHVDHRTISDPERDFAMGRRLIHDIAGRYQVRLQPVMVFPYERDSPSAIKILKQNGFVGMAQTPSNPSAIDVLDEIRNIKAIKASNGNLDDSFAILTRSEVESLTRDRMLARAALGLPLIATAHPRDVSLRRLAAIRSDSGGVGYFDNVLSFASAKKLRPMALEEIALEAIGAHQGTLSNLREAAAL